MPTSQSGGLPLRGGWRRSGDLFVSGWQVLKDLHPHINNNGFYPQGRYGSP
jgi:hypothetical protein